MFDELYNVHYFILYNIYIDNIMPDSPTMLTSILFSFNYFYFIQIMNNRIF